MKKIINLTQHQASPEQTKAGVVNHQNEQELKDLLTFDSLPSKEDIETRAKAIAKMAYGYEYAMIGGAPYLMGALEKELRERDITPLYAFTKRVTKEIEKDGKLVKTSVFTHEGFVEV